MPVVVFIGQFCAGGENFFGQIIFYILVGCFLLLQVNDTDDVAILIVSVAGTEFFLEQLDAVKVGGVGIIVVGNLDQNRIVGALCYNGSSCILPFNGAVSIVIKPDNLLIDNVSSVHKGGNQAKLPVIPNWHGVCFCPLCYKK